MTPRERMAQRANVEIGSEASNLDKTFIQATLDNLKPSQLNRGYGRPSQLEGLQASIAKVGVLQPVVVRPWPGGGFEIVDGHRRVAACQALGLMSIPAIVINTTLSQGALSHAANQYHLKETKLQQLVVILYTLAERLEVENHFDVASLLRKVHRTPGEFTDERALILEVLESYQIAFGTLVNHSLSLMKLPQNVYGALLAGKISEKSVKSLMRLTDLNQRDQWLERLSAGDPASTREFNDAMKAPVPAASLKTFRSHLGHLNKRGQRFAVLSPEKQLQATALLEQLRHLFE